MDADDELGAFRATFLAPEDGSVLAYLDGNSLGRPPVSTLDRLSDLVRRQWGTRLIRSWSEGWFELPEQIGDELGSVALGAAPGQVILGDSTTVLLYKVLRAAVAARPGRREIVTDVHNFPTDRYVVEGVADELGCRIRWLWTDQAAGVTARQLADVLGTDTAVVTLSHVAYRSAYLADMGALTRLVHDAGALTVWDLCHSVGSVPVELDALGVDFAVGCTYKFLCGGPGSPAFAYVAARHQADLRQPIWGWIGRVDPFAMAQGYRPAAGMRALLSGTPPVLALAGVAEGVALVAEAGIDRIRAKAMALAEMAVALTDSWLAPHGVTLASPRDPAHRGAHVTISRHDAEDLAAELIAAGVIIDFRPPDGIRIGLAPLSTGFDELWRGMDAMRRILAHHEP
ncbi:MAG: kynureninase [Sciscionella sp.]